MTTNIIDERLKTYTPITIEDEEHALKEILQEIALYGLANAKFFDHAIFHGGSALRILNDVAPFLNTQDKQALNLWGIDFFIDKLNKLENVFKI